MNERRPHYKIGRSGCVGFWESDNLKTISGGKIERKILGRGELEKEEIKLGFHKSS